MTDELRDLYRERAEYADIESDCQEAKKYTRYRGVFWRLFDWVERQAAKYRHAVSLDISELKDNSK